MSHFIDWNQEIYTSFEFIGNLCNIIHEIKRDFRERLAIAHYFTGSTDGRHFPVVLRKTTDEEVKAHCGVVLVKDDGLYFKNGSGSAKIKIPSMTTGEKSGFSECFITVSGVRFKSYRVPPVRTPTSDTTEFVLYEGINTSQDPRAIWYTGLDPGYYPNDIVINDEINALVIEAE